MDLKKTNPPKDSCEGDQTGGSFFCNGGTSLLFPTCSLSLKSYLEINTKFQWEMHHSPCAHYQDFETSDIVYCKIATIKRLSYFPNNYFVFINSAFYQHPEEDTNLHIPPCFMGMLA